jgi:hypothetical protein
MHSPCFPLDVLQFAQSRWNPGETLFDEPSVHRFASRVYPTEDRSTVLVAAPVDVVYHQKILL